MTVTKVIQYRTKPEHADENERLIRDVFAELAAEHPEGLRYLSLRLADTVSFLHVATIDGDFNPLSASAAFAKFQSGIKDRCDDGPNSSDATIIGSYRLLPEQRRDPPQ